MQNHFIQELDACAMELGMEVNIAHNYHLKLAMYSKGTEP